MTKGELFDRFGTDLLYFDECDQGTVSYIKRCGWEGVLMKKIEYGADISKISFRADEYIKFSATHPYKYSVHFFPHYGEAVEFFDL